VAKSTTKSKAIAVPASEKKMVAAVSEEMPEYMRGMAGKRLDTNFDESDLVRPQVKLTQSTSPQVKDAKAPIGEWWHTGAGISMGTEFKFCIAAAHKKIILFAPRGSDTPVLARADDAVHWDKPNTKFEVKDLKTKVKQVYNTKADVASSGLAEFGSSNPQDPDSPPAATLVYEFLVFFPDQPELGATVMSLSRTQLKNGKRLVTLIETRARAGDIFGCVFSARVTDDSRGDDDFYNVNFASAGFVEDKSFRDMVAAAAERMKSFRGDDDSYRGDAQGKASAAGETKY
jgi:hypothetical protein